MAHSITISLRHLLTLADKLLNDIDEHFSNNIEVRRGERAANHWNLNFHEKSQAREGREDEMKM